MAAKSALFLLALVLFVSTTMGSSYVEEVDNLETGHHHYNHSHHHHHAKAPVHAPSKAPKKAPLHAPIPPPPKARHAYPPASPPHGCVGMCASYCKLVSPKRHCMKTCTACCDKCKCVPVPGFKKCSNWDKVMIHGYIVKCP
ncbi:hypothetical protein ABFS82_11G127300 [Erythranthe guttata]|uniref:Gibberellin regulated protein n=1 Tax=Erythranthe guttata TaxID=4155 RepID=A0A022R749_ERYGU|nr:PREDICTED: gibberellin-regulated protein 14-like [Erythranthe guttata]EYU34700.1 hypothetical protein MIMGU_mgv1a015899mg [Erythranthe guttata]|eukprot:XP_012840530.1 PREDICTED: gibberellin-regulated protein 14-like [Erythranthe guttata]